MSHSNYTFDENMTVNYKITMKASCKLFFILQLFVLSCCNHVGEYYSPSELKSYEVEPIYDTLSCERVALDSTIIPIGVECIDDKVVLLTENKNALVTVLLSSNDSVISRFCRIGHAKDEFTSHFRMCQFSYDGKNIFMYIPDFYQNCVKEIDFNKSVKRNQACFMRSIKYKHDDRISLTTYYYQLLNGDGLLYQGLTTDGDAREAYSVPPSVKIYHGEDEHTISLYPKVISGNNRIVNLAYKSLLRVNPKQTKVVEALAFQDVFSIYSLEDHKTIGVCGEEGVEFERFSHLAQNVSFDSAVENIRIHNIFCNVSNDYIFLGQDGTLRLSEYESIVNSHPLIRIFDWDGNLLYSFKINEPVMCVAYNEKTKKLYGIDNDGNLYAYDLSAQVSVNLCTSRP